MNLHEEIKKRYELEADGLYPSSFVQRNAYLAARLKGFEEMMEFVEWAAEEHWRWHIGFKQWVSPFANGNRYTTAELYTLFKSK